jgi:hypothetical protein
VRLQRPTGPTPVRRELPGRHHALIMQGSERACSYSVPTLALNAPKHSRVGSLSNTWSDEHLSWVLNKPGACAVGQDGHGTYFTFVHWPKALFGAGSNLNEQAVVTRFVLKTGARALRQTNFIDAVTAAPSTAKVPCGD